MLMLLMTEYWREGKGLPFYLNFGSLGSSLSPKLGWKKQEKWKNYIG